MTVQQINTTSTPAAGLLDSVFSSQPTMLDSNPAGQVMNTLGDDDDDDWGEFDQYEDPNDVAFPTTLPKT